MISIKICNNAGKNRPHPFRNDPKLLYILNESVKLGLGFGSHFKAEIYFKEGRYWSLARGGLNPLPMDCFLILMNHFWKLEVV